MTADPQPLTAEELAAIRADLEQASPLDRECEELRAIAGLLATVEALQAQVAELTERSAKSSKLAAEEIHKGWTKVAELEAALAILDFEGEDDVGWNLNEALKGVECGRRSRNLLERVRDQLARARDALQGQAQRGEG